MRAIVIARRLGTCLQRATVTGLAPSGETAVASGGSAPVRSCLVGAREKSEDFADGGSGLVGSGSGTGAWTW